MAQVSRDFVKSEEPYFKAREHSSLVGRTQQVRRRSKVETAMDILRAMRGSQLGTHIMYRANLSWAVMSAWLRFLEQQKLIVIKIDGQVNRYPRKLYFLTSEGLELVDQWDAICKRLEVSKP